MIPAQALDRHGLLLEVLESSEPARDLLDLVTGRSVRGQGIYRGHTASADEARVAAQEPSAAPMLINHLRAGETFHVDGRMVPLVMKRAEQLEDTSQFGDYPPPTPCGLLVFDEPIVWVEAGGRRECVHMVSWGPGRFKQADHGNRLVHGTIVVLWNDAYRDQDEVALWLLHDSEESWSRTMAWTSGLLPMILLAETADTRLGPAWVAVSEERKAALRGDGLSPADSVVNPTRMVCAVWKLLDETITVVQPDHRVDRHHRKRAERKGIKPRVTVITLRRTDERGVEGARGPLTERHDVRGHWRTYWVGSGAGRHKVRRWITSHESPRDPLLPKAAYTRKVATLKR